MRELDTDELGIAHKKIVRRGKEIDKKYLVVEYVELIPRTTLCVLVNSSDGRVAYGVAIRDRKDRYILETARDISFSRAMDFFIEYIP